MFGTVGRRLVEGTIGLFALLGFLYVPLGQKTGFEHARAIFTTPAAKAAIDELTLAVFALRQRALQLLAGRAQTPGEREQDAEKMNLAAKASGPAPTPPKLK